MSMLAISPKTEVEAAQLALAIADIKGKLDYLRERALRIDNASAGSYKTRVGLADAADALEHSLAGLAEGFKVKL